jgi:hypothetical protein
LIKAILVIAIFLSLKIIKLFKTENTNELGTTSITKKRQGDTSKRLRIEQDDTCLGLK